MKTKKIKEEIVIKATEIKEAEKGQKGIVKIKFNGETTPIQIPKKPKKSPQKLQQKIELNEEIAPIQNIKPIKKSLHKPQESEIQKGKSLQAEEFIKEIEQEKEKEKEIEQLIKEIEKEKEKEIEQPKIDNSIEDLEKEIKEKRKILKQKKKDEQEERIRQEEEAKERIRQEEEKRKQEEANIVPQQQGIIIEERIIEEIKLNPDVSSPINYGVCPLCSSKIKRKKIKQEGFILKQIIKCKNKKCIFQKNIVFNL